VGFVAALEVELLVEVELGVDVVPGVLVVEEVEEDDFELEVGVAVEQSRWASWFTVVAP
jgi:hypothetical protein